MFHDALLDLFDSIMVFVQHLSHTGKVELVWEPPWTPDKMSEAAKLQLGMM